MSTKKAGARSAPKRKQDLYERRQAEAAGEIDQLAKLAAQLAVDKARLHRQQAHTIIIGGKKFDAGKVRLDLIPPSLILGVGRVLTFGAAKYGDRNWEQGMAWSRCYGAAMRHLVTWWDGENADDETGYSHLEHALCCIGFLNEYRTTQPSHDDRPAIIARAA